MEFYLVDDLECDFVVFHPYRTLLTLCKKGASDSASSSLFGGSEEGEADEMGAGIDADDGPRYWGTGEGRLELTEDALQTAWFIINDTYRSDLCLLHPPHIIAIAALYLTFTIHSPSSKSTIPQSVSSADLSSLGHVPISTPQPRRSSRQHPPPEEVKAETKPQDPIEFFAELNVSLSLIATVAQEIISLYTLWERYKESGAPEGKGQGQSPMSGSVSPAKRSAAGSNVGTPMDVDEAEGWNEEEYVTPKFLSHLLIKMREARLGDMSHPASGRPLAVNKMLERTQAAG
ncbi:hypothetical protein C0991_011887 [Blastosporella zonata]|nr:hypothetical protein C0991_011887 [Blastosporella zonata]